MYKFAQSDIGLMLLKLKVQLNLAFRQTLNLSFQSKQFPI